MFVHVKAGCGYRQKIYNFYMDPKIGRVDSDPRIPRLNRYFRNILGTCYSLTINWHRKIDFHRERQTLNHLRYITLNLTSG